MKIDTETLIDILVLIIGIFSLGFIMFCLTIWS